MHSRIPLAIGLSGALLAAGCMDGTMGDDRSRTQSGAIAGATIGAAAGVLTGSGNRFERAAVGAVVGGIAGGAIGAVLDRQAAELRRDLGSNVDVRNTGSQLVLTMPQDILFATDSAVLRPDLQSDLRVLAANLQRYPESRITVIGHTDNTGSAAYNQTLSERRAGAVAAVLRDAGVPGWRISAIGRGLTQPVASNATPEGRRLNRRVEIVITPTS